MLNLIILCPDEMRGDCAGFMGNPDIRTPHLDAFAGESVVFQHHMAVFPKCVPARITLMTGRYSHTDGYRTVSQTMAPDQANLLDRFRAQGYEAAVFGKNHCWAPKDWDALDYTSYSEPYGAWMEGVPRLRRHEPDPGSPEPPDLEDGWHYVGCNTRHAGDEVFTKQAVDFLTQRRDPDRPFFLQINFESPHPVYGVEEPWYSMYDRGEILAWPHDLPEDAPLPVVKQREIRTGTAPQPDAAREVQAVYYGMISKLDGQIGEVLAAVDAAGLRDDTVVLLWSDHGDYAGQYTLAEKWDTSFADCLIHVPFVVRAPGLPQGLRVDSLSEHTDVAPTLCDLLGFEPLPGMHGTSLLPVVRGKQRQRAAFAEGGHEAPMRARFQGATQGRLADGASRRLAKNETYLRCPDTMARAKMVRTDRYKLVVRETGGNELYDLENDPWELHNRWGDPALADVVPELLLLLVRWSLRSDPDTPYLERFTV
jgi:choline-sulfatase